MRWLLLKDLQIMRRSPLVTALLLAYPILIAVLIGFSLSRGPQTPKVAILNQVPADATIGIGKESFDVGEVKSELCARIDCVSVDSEQAARDMVSSGDALGALILPADLVDKLQSLGGLTPEAPMVKILVNESDPLKGQLVDDRINSLLADANLKVSKQISDVANTYLGILLDGGDLSIFGQGLQVLGLKASSQILTEVRSELPPGSPAGNNLDEVIRFSNLAIQNLGVAGDLLDSVSQPIGVDKEVVNGKSASLDDFAIAVAATVTLMFVTVLLVAGSLALEREENAWARLTRGLVGKSALLGEKVLLGVVVSLVVTILMLAGIGIFISLDWSRFPLWIPAILAGGASFGALGAAIGGAAKEVRAASLLAFMISLPLAFLSLVPSGTVSAGLYDVIEVIAALFPFDAALRALQGALDADGPSVLAAIGQLLALTVAYGALARVAVRRFT